MGLLQNVIKGMKGSKDDFKEQLKQAQLDDKVERTVQERAKSSNRRELERFYKEQEEEQIKKTLEKIHHKQTSDMWKSKNGIMSDKMTILKEDKPILKEKNIFKNNPNMFTKEHSIKHKTDMGFFK